MNVRLFAAALAALLCSTAGANAAEEGESRLPERRTTVVLQTGATARSLFSLPIFGGEVGVAVGGIRTGRSAESAELQFVGLYGLGRTESGLLAHTVRAGGRFEWTIEALRIDLGMNLMWFGLSRASSSDGVVQHWGIGLMVRGTVDVATAEDKSAVFVGLRGDVDVFPHKLVPRTLSPCGAFEIGYRF